MDGFEHDACEELDPQVRAVYEQLGLGMALAQSIEQALAVILACASESIYTRADLHAAEQRWRKRTFGRLVGELSRVASVPPAVADELAECVAIRNAIAHDYIELRCADFQTPQGRRAMLAELDRWTTRLDDLHEYFVQVMVRWPQFGALDAATLTACLRFLGM